MFRSPAQTWADADAEVIFSIAAANELELQIKSYIGLRFCKGAPASAEVLVVHTLEAEEAAGYY